MEGLEKRLLQHFGSAADRDKGAAFINKNPRFFNELLALACNTQADRQHIVAAWIFEKYTLPRLAILHSVLAEFINGVSVQTHESKRRPMIKLLYHYTRKKEYREKLSSTHIDAIVQLCFDYMLSAKKVAAIAFAMKTLHFFRSHRKWIDEELNAYIEIQLPNASNGFKSVVRQISKIDV